MEKTQQRDSNHWIKKTLLFIKSWLYRNTYRSCLENKVCLRLYLLLPHTPQALNTSKSLLMLKNYSVQS